MRKEDIEMLGSRAKLGLGGIRYTLYAYLFIFWYGFKIRLGRNKEIWPLGRSVGESKIHCVYFSCKNDFEYLLISLKSLEKLNLPCIGKVYLYIDKGNPLSNEQIKELKKRITFDVIVGTTRYKAKFPGAGLGVILSELIAFREIIPGINQNDYVAKIDSDVLFISDMIFKEVIKGESEAVGYILGRSACMDGGCYFIKSSLLSKMVKHPVYRAVLDASRVSRELIFKCSEDRIMTELVKQSDGKIVFNRDMFLRERVLNLNRIKEIINNEINKGKVMLSAIHFTRWHCNKHGLKKEQMMEIWKRLPLEK